MDNSDLGLYLGTIIFAMFAISIITRPKKDNDYLDEWVNRLDCIFKRKRQ
jgi:hypothetical protein